MRYTHAFFDLDGTLTDSAPGITHSVQYALRKFGIDPPPEEDLRVFVGPPLVWSFSHVFGFSEEEAKLAVAYYREYYRERGIYENSVYPGIPELLAHLSDKGIICVLATCKPHVFASKILSHFSLDKYFSYVSGPELDGTRGENHEVIAEALRALQGLDPRQALMIGDRKHDAIGAAYHGMDCVGVLWGFGTQGELLDAGVRYLCSSAPEIEHIFAD